MGSSLYTFEAVHPAAQNKRFSLAGHWPTQELVTIGVFAAVIKASTLLVAFMGGGMNPVTLMAKNCLFAMLMIVLLHKAPRTGTLTLATLINILVSLVLMGQGMLSIPGSLVVCLLAEGVIAACGGYRKTTAIVLGVLFFEIGSKAFSLIVSYLSLREQPGMMLSVFAFVAIGSLGTFMGLFCGIRFTRELRHAGIISA